MSDHFASQQQDQSSIAGASADSSLIKSWISIKDIKLMVNQGSKYTKDPEKTKNLPL